MANYKHKKRESIETRVVMAIGRGLWALVKLPFSKKNIKSADFTKRWNDIQTLMNKDDSSSWASAILKADSVLNDALKIRFSGENLADRLRSAQDKIDPETYSLAWQAHKLRNKIAHEHFDVSRQEASQAIYQFRSILNSLGVL